MEGAGNQKPLNRRSDSMKENSKYFLIDKDRLLEAMREDMQVLQMINDDKDNHDDVLTAQIDMLKDYINDIENHLYDWQPED